MTIKEALEIERKRLLAEAEAVAAMPVWVKPDGDGWDLTEHVICPVCGERTLYERGHFPPSKVLCEHQGVALAELRKHGFDTGIEITRNTPDSTYEVLKLRAQLETARKAIENAPHSPSCKWEDCEPCNCWKSEALAQIGAGQEGGK